MKIGILGTGMVGKAIGDKLIQLGHDVRMGARTAGSTAGTAWASAHGSRASEGSFADAVAHGEVVFNCLKGEVVLETLRAIGPERFRGKVLVDVSVPLDFSRGMPPTLLFCNTTSQGEQVQELLVGASVVKTLNIVNCDVMVDPARSGGAPTMLLCGEDAGAKARVISLLRDFGWQDLVDLGGIRHARGTEMMLPVWLSLWQTFGTLDFGFKLVRP